MKPYCWFYGALAVLSQAQQKMSIYILTLFLNLPTTPLVQTTVKIMSPAVYRLLCCEIFTVSKFKPAKILKSTSFDKHY